MCIYYTKYVHIYCIILNGVCHTCVSTAVGEAQPVNAEPHHYIILHIYIILCRAYYIWDCQSIYLVGCVCIAISAAIVGGSACLVFAKC